MDHPVSADTQVASNSLASNPSNSSGILSLPNELLSRILAPSLHANAAYSEHAKAQSETWLTYCLDHGIQHLGGGPFVSTVYAPHALARPFPQVLRVCRRFYEVGIPLLYENILVVEILSDRDSEERYYDRLEALITNAKRGPDGNGLWKKLMIKVNTSTHHRQNRVKADAETLTEVCKLLGDHRSCYDQILVLLIDHSRDSTYTRYQPGLDLMLGLGNLHCKVATCWGIIPRIAAELAWCMRQSKFAQPPSSLSSKLDQFLCRFVGPGADGTLLPTNMRIWFGQEAQSAVKNNNLVGFFVNLDAAVEFALAIVEGGLSGPVYGLKWHEQNIVKVAHEEAGNLRAEARYLLSLEDIPIFEHTEMTDVHESHLVDR